MMLPEHVRMLGQHQKDFERRTKPVIDEQEAERMSNLLTDAMERGSKVRITLFDPYEDRFVEGNIQTLDVKNQQMKVQNQAGFVWVRMDDVIDVDDAAQV